MAATFDCDCNCNCNRSPCKIKPTLRKHTKTSRKPPQKAEFRPFPSIDSCSTFGRSTQKIISSLNSSLLRSSSPFPYFLLLSLEAGSPLRAFLLLALYPLVFLLSLCDPSLSLQIFVFISTAGLSFSQVQGVSKAVLPKFFLEDLHSQTFEVFMSCSKRYVVTSYPRVMVEYFLREHLGVDDVLGTELHVTGYGVCSGLVARETGVLMGKRKLKAVKKLLGDEKPDIALGGRESDYPFMSFSKEAYIVNADGRSAGVETVPREQYRKPLTFHDGRLAKRPTPLTALAVFLWAPFGLLLAFIRILMVLCLPLEVGMPLAALLGMCIRVKGAPPLPLPAGNKQGILFVSTHRTLLDPTYMCVGLRRKVRALAYSVSWVSELMSPIKTASLTRDREEDRHLISELLEKEEDLFVCPEGTTCREPYLLRFSPLFAELTEHIVPVGMKLKVGMFHGTSARGYKALDSFFYLMNPKPECEILFLERLAKEETVGGGGKTSVEVARAVQKQLADALGYCCTELTRKDKYMVLAGNDGTVKDKRFTPRTSVTMARANIKLTATNGTPSKSF